MTTYTVAAMSGDFPLPGQPHWDEEFNDLAMAKAAAVRTYNHFLASGPHADLFHVVVTSEEGDKVHILIDHEGKVRFDQDAQRLADQLEACE